jgi:anaerobic selenocysteine-containing dehydrogenase
VATGGDRHSKWGGSSLLGGKPSVAVGGAIAAVELGGGDCEPRAGDALQPTGQLREIHVAVLCARRRDPERGSGADPADHAALFSALADQRDDFERVTAAHANGLRQPRHAHALASPAAATTGIGGLAQELPVDPSDICPKGVALGEVRHDPDRIRRPLKRNGERWTEIGWDEALDETADRLKATQKLHGDDAVAVYLGNPTVHNLGAILFVPDFVRALRTKNCFSATSVDQLAHQVASWAMFGHQLLFPIPDIDRTDFFLIVGGNPVASNGSLMTVPDVRNRLAAIRERGGRVVVVDPRRGETASIADQHLFIRPGSDVFLFLALLQVIFAEQLDAPGRLASFSDGLDAVRTAVAAWGPERAAGLTGIAARDISALARSFAGAPTAVAHARMGASTQAHGGLCQWLVQVLNIVTGNLDRPGGALFTSPALDALPNVGRGSLGRWRSRVRGLPEFGGELPVATLAEEIDTSGPGAVRALVTHAGNPALSTPNGRRLERAIASLEFFVAIDFYRNETTRHAHLILPPTEPLEHTHYDVAFYLLSVRNFARSLAAVGSTRRRVCSWTRLRRSRRSSRSRLGHPSCC